MPHFFDRQGSDTTNRSRQAGAKDERLRSLIAAICGPHQALGTATYGLDHQQAKAWRMMPKNPYTIDLVVCTTGDKHLLNEVQALSALFHHHPTDAEPLMLGFECHKVLRDARGRYDYYGFVEDDVVITDPLFFTKRRLFDRVFPELALLQPNRYELNPAGPVNKLYVDYRLNPRVTETYQNLADEPRIEMPFVDDVVVFERTTYPSAGCFFLNGEQLDHWIESPFFLDGDVSYMSPLDSAVTLSVMKTFRVYKARLEQAWFLEVLHASPRWIGSVANIAVLSDVRDR
jgi:hypothetical protein